jgi:hypothetical protein
MTLERVPVVVVERVERVAGDQRVEIGIRHRGCGHEGSGRYSSKSRFQFGRGSHPGEPLPMAVCQPAFVLAKPDCGSAS